MSSSNLKDTLQANLFQGRGEEDIPSPDSFDPSPAQDHQSEDNGAVLVQEHVSELLQSLRESAALASKLASRNSPPVWNPKRKKAAAQVTESSDFLTVDDVVTEEPEIVHVEQPEEEEAVIPEPVFVAPVQPEPVVVPKPVAVVAPPTPVVAAPQKPVEKVEAALVSPVPPPPAQPQPQQQKPLSAADEDRALGRTWIDPSGGKRAPIPTVGTPASTISPRDPRHRFRVDDHKRRPDDKMWKPDLPDTLLPQQPPLLPKEKLPALVGFVPSKYTGFTSQVPKEDYLKQLELKEQIALPELLKLNKYPLEPPYEELPETPEPAPLGSNPSRQEIWEENNPRALGKEDLPDLEFYPKVHVRPDQLPQFLGEQSKLSKLEKDTNPFGQYVLGDLKGILGLQGSDFEVQRQWMKIDHSARSEFIKTNWRLTQVKYCGRSLGRYTQCQKTSHRAYAECHPLLQAYRACMTHVNNYFTNTCQADHIAFMDAVYNINDFKTVSVAFRELQKCFMLPRIKQWDFWNL